MCTRLHKTELRNIFRIQSMLVNTCFDQFPLAPLLHVSNLMFTMTVCIPDNDLSQWQHITERHKNIHSHSSLC